MRKIFVLTFIFAIFLSGSLFAQHTVNDVSKYGGWYKIKIELQQSGSSIYYITQCYPSGEEYEVIGAEREQLPLYLKILCMILAEEYIAESFGLDEMIFEEDGIFMQFSSFSFTIIFKFSRPENEIEAEILSGLDEETINRYKNRKW